MRSNHIGPQPYGSILTKSKAEKSIFSFGFRHNARPAQAVGTISKIYICTGQRLRTSMLPTDRRHILHDGHKQRSNNSSQTTALRANILGITVYRQTKSNKANEHNQKNYREQARPGAVLAINTYWASTSPSNLGASQSETRVLLVMLKCWYDEYTNMGHVKQTCGSLCPSASWA